MSKDNASTSSNISLLFKPVTSVISYPDDLHHL